MPLDIENARSRLAALERADPSQLRQRIDELATPRLTGSDGAAEIERALRQRFEALGFRVEELGFSFSALPGRFGLAVGGALAVLTGVGGTWLLLAGNPVLALVVLVLGMAAAVAPLLLLGRASRRLPWGRTDSANLLFTRPDARPSWIVMAHRDSKSQLVPTLVRTVATGAAVLAWLALVVLAALWIGGDALQLPTAVWVAGSVLVLSALLLALSWAANASPGALDNASGMAALLTVADRVGESGDVAFLLTDGEELGLIGARHVVDQLPPVQGVINVDGLDDGGETYVMEGHGWSRKGSAPQLVAALLAAGEALDLPVSRRTLPRYLMVDHLPIAAAGIPAVTVMRGGTSSLMRVHTPADRPDALSGQGAAQAATLLVAALTLLGDAEAPHLARRRATGS